MSRDDTRRLVIVASASYNVKNMHGFSLVSPSGQVYDGQILCLKNVDSGDLVTCDDLFLLIFPELNADQFDNE